MKRAPGVLLLFRVSRIQAEALGLVRCECGHPSSNHFDGGRNPCGHCDCREYKETSPNILRRRSARKRRQKQ